MKIALVGEAWGAEEERARMPFVGPSGYALKKMLEEAGLAYVDCHATNVFNLRPANNDIETLCGPKSAVSNPLPPLRQGKYILDAYTGHVSRLIEELVDVRPNLIIALGNTAAWALLGDPRISKIRGTIAWSAACSAKVMPAYHPAAILRQWELRHVTVLDFMKAKREAEFPEVRRPSRSVWIYPAVEDIELFLREYCDGSSGEVAVDIETVGDQITCIGFAPRTDLALVVPFWSPSGGGNYWQSSQNECKAWAHCRTFLTSPVPKVFQNGLYDVRFLWQQYGIPVKNWTHDTMLLHHALYPESEKGLGFLGSVYTNEPSWKMMRARGKGTIKQEE